MTKAEYNSFYAEARTEASKLSIAAQKKLRKAYTQAAKDIEPIIIDAVSRGLSELTITHWQQVLVELNSATAELSKQITNSASSLVESSVGLYTSIDAEFITQSIAKAGVSGISSQGVLNMASGVNHLAAESMVSRIYKDGYTFSDRVWSAKGDWEKSIKEILARGIASGRDPAKLVRDIQIYTADGRLALAQRWAGLDIDTAEWKSRLPKEIDWRAVRLVRSEMQASLQTASFLAGEMNVGASGQYTWVLGPGLVHCEHCLELAEQTFTQENIPDYPHPNCGCQIRPVLRDHDQFIKDLREWGNGNVTAQNRYVDVWYNNKYLKAV